MQLTQTGLVLLLVAFTSLVLGTECHAVLPPEIGASVATPRVLVAYFSVSGWTERLATHVEEGAIAQQARTRLLRTQNVTCADFLWADAIVIGTPVYLANVAADKVGAAFATGGHVSSGKDLAMQTILAAFSSMDMVIIGGTDAFGASATHADAEPKVAFSKAEIASARYLGSRAATVAALITAGKDAHTRAYAAAAGQATADSAPLQA